MFETVKALFMSRKQSLPSPEKQANIGNLAVHYLDELCTRIERLTSSGQIKAAKAEADALVSCLRRLNNPENAQEAFDTTSCSTPCRLAIEYVEKLFSLQNTLIEANRIQEAQGLAVFFEQINRRICKYKKTLEDSTMRKQTKKKSARIKAQRSGESSR